MPTRPVPTTDAVRRLSEAMPKAMFKKALNTSLTEGTAKSNVAYGERTDERAVARNGYRKRELVPQVGTIQLALPRVRQGKDLQRFRVPRASGMYSA